MDSALIDLYVRSYVADLTWTMAEIDRAALGRVIALLLDARAAGRQVLLAGNGGSAAAASHMACDLGKGTVDFGNPAFTRFRVISLADNNALITAIGNDLGYDEIFSEQLKMLMQPGDVVIFISSSGNSPNLVRAAEHARAHGATTVGLLGFGGGKLAPMMDVPLVVSSRNYGITEDFHMSVQHIYTQYLRRALAGPLQRVAFLDRDGIINERAAEHAYIERWDDFRFRAGAVAMLSGLAADGYRLVVVTNQQGVGKGRMTETDLKGIHASMTTALAEEGVTLAGIFACPHLAGRECFCRKPEPGLIYRALNELPFLVDLPHSILIGDAGTDVAAARAAGIPTRILVSDVLDEAATHVVADLAHVRPLLQAARD
jgi:D-sedoheptulose 7-phosphate isomerase